MKKVLAILALLLVVNNKPCIKSKILTLTLESLKENPKIKKYKGFTKDKVALVTTDLDENLRIYSVMMQINKKTKKFSSIRIYYANQPKKKYKPCSDAFRGHEFTAKDMKNNKISPLLAKLILIIFRSPQFKRITGLTYKAAKSLNPDLIARTRI